MNETVAWLLKQAGAGGFLLPPKPSSKARSKRKARPATRTPQSPGEWLRAVDEDGDDEER